MKEIKNSYFHYLYNLGLSDVPFNYSYEGVYEELLALDLSNEALTKKLVKKLNSRMITSDLMGIIKQDIRNHFIVSKILFQTNNNTFGDYKLYALNQKTTKKFIMGKDRKKRDDYYAETYDIILIGKGEDERKEYGIPKHAVQITNIDNIDPEEKNTLIELMSSEPDFIDYRTKNSIIEKPLEKIKRRLPIRRKCIGDSI